jgi:hypothetical protein
MGSSQVEGLEGHQWRLHRTSGTRMPYRVLCECGWTSTAGPETSVLLELKGHLEDSLHDGAAVLRGQTAFPAPEPSFG